MAYLQKLRSFIIFFLIIVMFFILNSKISRADDISLVGRMGEGVRPIANTDIKMISELVKIQVDKMESKVEVDFVFQNTGEKAEILMGVPGEASNVSTSERKVDTALYDFKVFLDNQKLTVKKEKGIFLNDGDNEFNYSFWYTWPVKFDKNEIRSIKNTYRVKNTLDSTGEIQTGYILKTGASWEGNIGEAKIVLEMIDILPYHLEGVFPADYSFEGEDLVWYYKNFEPSENIRIVANPMKEYKDGGNILGWNHIEELNKYEQLGQYELALGYLDALKDNDQIKNEEQEEYYLLKKAIYLYKWGNEKETEDILVKLMKSESKYPQVYYYLAKLYADEGNQRKLLNVYKKVQKLKINPQLIRWIGSLLSEERIKENSPVISSMQLVRSKDSLDLFFNALVDDIDGNLQKIKVELWCNENGKKKELANYQPQFYHQPYEYEIEIPLGQLPYYTVVYGRIIAEDVKGNVVDSGVRSFLVQDIRTGWVSLPIGKINFNYIDLGNREINKIKVLFKQALKEIKQELYLEPKTVIHANIIGDNAQVIYDEKGYREDFFQETYSLKTKEPNRKLANQIMLRILTQNTGEGWLKASYWLLDDLTQNVVFNKTKVKTAYLRDQGEERFQQFLLRIGETGDVESALQEIYGINMKTLNERWTVFKLIPWLTVAGIFIFITSILLWWRRKQLREQDSRQG
ncbi:MAG TPA: hypothetical protein GXX38_06860 [Clostridia bacterium]|nr:hypothetical protein [Clostridia bacterium]